MSARRATPLFDGATEHACSVCDAIHKTAEGALRCREKHEKESRREAARKFARTGVSQVRKRGSR